MLRLRINATPDSARRRINGATYEPEETSSLLQAVAMKEAAIREKLMML